MGSGVHFRGNDLRSSAISRNEGRKGPAQQDLECKYREEEICREMEKELCSLLCAIFEVLLAHNNVLESLSARSGLSYQSTQLSSLARRAPTILTVK